DLINDKYRYKVDSWNYFMDSLNNANKVYDTNASQNTVNNATERLVNSINSLVVKDPIISVSGLEKLEGKNNNITINKPFNIVVDSRDIGGKKIKQHVELNGFPVAPIQGEYKLPLVEGVNKVVITTTDDFGGKATEQFEIQYVTDLTPTIEHSIISNDNVKDGVFTFNTKAFDYKNDHLDVAVTHNGNEVLVEN